MITDAALTLIAIVLIFSGGAFLSMAFKPKYQKFGPLIVGIVLIAAGFYVLPTQSHDAPDAYLRK